MEIKFTVQGLLVYLTMAAFLTAATLLRCKRERVGNAVWFVGFAVATASVIYRGLHSSHLPMQNLFEVFLCMAAALWPLAWLTRRLTGIDTTVQDAVLGFVLLWPVGFVFSDELRRLPPALQSPLFLPHVALYIIGYVMLARAAVMALPLFKQPDAKLERAAFVTAVCGFLPLSIAFVLGAVWGKLAWGHYWQWDPKEMWSLATWLTYGAYFHFRLRYGAARPKTSAGLLWLGLLMIALTLTWINVSRLFVGVHNYAS